MLASHSINLFTSNQTDSRNILRITVGFKHIKFCFPQLHRIVVREEQRYYNIVELELMKVKYSANSRVATILFFSTDKIIQP